MVKPIFIFSLPRSGSTLLQSLLGGHGDISTTPEPWVLLPIFYSLRSKGVYAEYSHNMASAAIEDLLEHLPNGKEDYLKAINKLGTELYGSLARGKDYFLDKTPRYHAICEDIMRAFPEGKFIFLYRNPLATLGSILETWQNFHFFRYDLYQGQESLIRTEYTAGLDFIKVYFEDLVQDPVIEVTKICRYLQIDYDPRMVGNIVQNKIPEGKYGNPGRPRYKETREYNVVSKDPIEKWKSSLGSSIIRKRYAIEYLKWLEEESLIPERYNFKSLYNGLRELNVTNSTLLSDLYKYVRGGVSANFETKLLRDKLGVISDPHQIFPHQ